MRTAPPQGHHKFSNFHESLRCSVAAAIHPTSETMSGMERLEAAVFPLIPQLSTCAFSTLMQERAGRSQRQIFCLYSLLTYFGYLHITLNI